jgi:hypothetical protein
VLVIDFEGNHLEENVIDNMMFDTYSIIAYMCFKERGCEYQTLFPIKFDGKECFEPHEILQ